MMKDAFRISEVPAKAVYPLRLLVLRRGGHLEDCIWPGDEALSTFHLAAIRTNGDIVGIASFYANGHASVEAKRPIQLRGMATHPSVRGKGAGKQLIFHALDVLKANGIDVLWCNAREVAVEFYLALGFKKIGEPFTIQGIGIHWVMIRKV